MRILLIGGWGMPAAVLEPLRMALGIGREHCLLLDRPMAQWRQQAMTAVTPGSVLVGWSLGGSLALNLAGELRERPWSPLAPTRTFWPRLNGRMAMTLSNFPSLPRRLSASRRPRWRDSPLWPRWVVITSGRRLAGCGCNWSRSH